ncbi:maleylpyruvate isomerase N-terminal domain-containing protein [Streptomyces sp. NPDC057638]|uniref:maleylpyruvate isomerase N-terminal domain-containing protein n=1 Tax=Streptomyces sp. NPDC057638 TaxID=3346190 RepID=UPI003679D50A
MSDALLNTLVDAVADLVTAVSDCDEELLDPDTAEQWLEHVGALLDRLSPADRATLSTRLRQSAARRPAGGRRDAVLRIPEEFGLDDDQHELYCDGLEYLGRRLVKTVRDVDPATPLPTRPGQSVADLVLRHGATHRWARRLIQGRASGEVPPERPGHPAGYPDWLARSAADTLAALRAADPETPVWTPGADQRVRYYARRLLLATVIALADAELALGQEPRVPAGTGADGIEEFFENLSHDPRRAARLSALTPAPLRLAATDTGAAWTVTPQPGGRPRWTGRAPVGTTARVSVEGSGGDLLLLLYGRFRPEAPRFQVRGERALLEEWLAATAYEGDADPEPPG